ncbi:MAG: hypothetical protein ACPGJS_04310 [Flammeovirgaceae bacterium]
MKKILFLPFILCLILGFTNKTGEAPNGIKLKGTWVMVSEKHGDEPAEKSKKGMGIVKKKFLTGTHFSWVEYNEAGEMMSLGGGSYTLEEDNKYVEVIEYFYPKGSGLLGVSIPFKCKLEGKKWTHTGIIQHREIDGETGEYEVVNSERLEEVWERID